MKADQNRCDQDAVLDLAYGELEPKLASKVESHLAGCAKCQAQLSSIRHVRSTMGKLSPESAPQAGLGSLLAYAGSARSRASVRKTRPWGWIVSWGAGLVVVSSLGVVTIGGDSLRRAFGTSAAALSGAAQVGGSQAGRALTNFDGPEGVSENAPGASMPAAEPTAPTALQRLNRPALGNEASGRVAGLGGVARRNAGAGSSEKEEPAAGALSVAAQRAFERGDRAEEARLLRGALSLPGQTWEREGLLNRLCDAERAQGKPDGSGCVELANEFPRSVERPGAAAARAASSPPADAAKIKAKAAKSIDAAAH